MSKPTMRLSDLKGATLNSPAKPKPQGGKGTGETYAPPTPRVSRQKKGKVLTPEERAAFLASRPDLKS